MFNLHFAAASLALLSGVVAQSSAATITATSINSQQGSAMISDLSSYFVSYQSQFTKTADPSVLSIYSDVADTITAFVPVETAVESQVVSMFVESFSEFRDAINSAVTLDTNRPQVSAILGDDVAGFVNQTVQLADAIASIVNRDSAANGATALKVSAGLAAAAAVIAVVL